MEAILAFISVKNCNSFIPNSRTSSVKRYQKVHLKQKILNLMLECQNPSVNSDLLKQVHEKTYYI